MNDEYIKRRYGKIKGSQKNIYDMPAIQSLSPNNFSSNVYPKNVYQSVVKMNFTSPDRLKQIANYINRSSARGDEKMFTETKENIMPKDLKEIKGEKNLFRMILSPKYAGAIDMKLYTRMFVIEMNKRLGLDLDYVCVVHTNTTQPHSHLLIRGIDTMGRRVHIPKDFIKTEMRDIGSLVAEKIVDTYKLEKEMFFIDRVNDTVSNFLDENIIKKNTTRDLTRFEMMRYKHIIKNHFPFIDISKDRIFDYREYINSHGINIVKENISNEKDSKYYV